MNNIKVVRGYAKPKQDLSNGSDVESSGSEK